MSAGQWTTTGGDTVTVYKDAGSGYRYRITARNGEVVEQGSESYTRREDATEAARRHHPEVHEW